MNINFPLISQHFPISRLGYPEDGWIFHVCSAPRECFQTFPEPAAIGSTTGIIPDWTGWEFGLINLINRWKLSSASHHPPDFAIGWSQGSPWHSQGIFGVSWAGPESGLDDPCGISNPEYSIILSSPLQWQKCLIFWWMGRNFECSLIICWNVQHGTSPNPQIPSEWGFGEGKLWNVGLGVRSRVWEEKWEYFGYWHWNDTTRDMKNWGTPKQNTRKEKQEYFGYWH